MATEMLDMPGTLFVFPLITFFAFLIAQGFVIELLRKNYSGIYKEMGSPWIGWGGFRNYSITWWFIFLRKYKNYDLDLKTNLWCNIGFLFLTLFCVACPKFHVQINKVV